MPCLGSESTFAGFVQVFPPSFDSQKTILDERPPRPEVLRAFSPLFENMATNVPFFLLKTLALIIRLLPIPFPEKITFLSEKVLPWSLENAKQKETNP